MFSLPKWEKHRQQQEMQDIHSALKTDQTLQDNHIFTHIHSIQEKSWQPVKAMITTHTNTFSTQQKQKGMILLSKRMTVTSLLCQLNAEDLTEGIIREKDQIETNNSTPLIKDLEISNIFKDKNDEEGNGVIDELLDKVSQLLVLVGLVAQQVKDIITGQM